VWLAANRGGDGEGSGGRMDGGRTNVNHDAVDGRFKLCSPSKIVFDIGVRSFDKNIKIFIILQIF
jgi:hypothetical protein